MNYIIHLLIYADIFIIVSLSLNLVVGYCGLLSLAHAGYYAVGAYTYALLSLAAGWPAIPAIVGSALVAGTLSLALSLPSWKLKGDYFVLTTLAVQALIFSVLNNWSDGMSALGSWANLTNGSFGIAAIPKPSVLGFEFSSPDRFLVLATIAMLLCAMLVWRLTSSPWGRVVIAMRDDELAARGLGKNTRLLKLQALAFASGLAGLAGGLFASYIGFIDPWAASLDESVLMLSMVIVGGIGNFRGPIVGAVTLVMLPEVIRLLQFPDAFAANLRLAIYGLLLVLFMHFRPQGLWGKYRLS